MMNAPIRYTILVVAVLCLASCSEDDKITDPGTPPVLVVSTDSLEITDLDPEATVQLVASKRGSITWKVTGSPAWASVAPESGAANENGTSVVIQGDASSLSPGTYSGAVSITSTGGDAEIHVSFLVGATGLDASPDSLIYDYFVDSATFTVENSGNALLAWTASTASTHLQMDVTSGTLAPGADAIVSVSLNRAGLSTGSHVGSILVEAEGGQTDTIGVRVLHFVEAKWLLDHQLVDAEFSRTTNRIVAVSDDPPTIHRLDPEARTIQSIPLPTSPRCVAMRPDGAYAAVGHNGFVTYVDMNAMSIVATHNVSADAFDILLPSNGWVYVFPTQDQWEYVRCIELATGVETLQTGSQIYAGMKGRLHPSGLTFYGTDRNISPSDMYKFSVGSGTAALLYDSPYHGDYAIGVDLWVSDDGARIFAYSGDVFRSSTTQNQDMIYNGHLNGLSAARWIEHSTQAGRIFAIAGDTYIGEAPSEIRTYRADFLASLASIPLPPYLVPDGGDGGTLYRSKGQFVFVNEGGTRLYALVRAASGSGLVHDWALWASDINALP